MVDALNNFFGQISNFLWGNFYMIVLVMTGVMFTVRLGFPQIRHLGDSFRLTFAGIRQKGKAGKDGMSAWQSLATAIAGQVGTGNIAGPATAIMAGGPGAIFWMWVSAFFGMGTIFSEAVAAQKYKATLEDGSVIALIGSNGAGKSTLLNTISGLVRPRSGSVLFDGRDITKEKPENIMKSGIIQCPEGRKVFGNLTVYPKPAGRRPDPEGPAGGQGARRTPDGAVPPPAGAPQPAGGDAQRRRAADAGHVPLPHGEPQVPPAGRALHGSLPHHGEGDLRHHPPDQ